jgi:hypothetical protein
MISQSISQMRMCKALATSINPISRIAAIQMALDRSEYMNMLASCYSQTALSLKAKGLPHYHWSARAMRCSHAAAQLSRSVINNLFL